MTLITHCIGGAVSVALLDTIVPSFTADKLSYIVGIAVATLPDLDYSRSFIGRVFHPLSTFIESKVPHRTATHSFIAALLVSLFLGWLLSFSVGDSLLKWMVIVFGGYMSHIFLDWFTKKGCQSYWPAQGWCVMFNRRSWRIKTGSFGELFHVAILLLFFGVTFQPTRDAVQVWARSSFIQSKDEELERFDIKRNQITNGFTLEQIDSLHNVGIITGFERQEMIYELQNIDLNERTTRKLYGLPDGE